MSTHQLICDRCGEPVGDPSSERPNSDGAIIVAEADMIGFGRMALTDVCDDCKEKVPGLVEALFGSAVKRIEERKVNHEEAN